MFCKITVDSWNATLSLFDIITDKNSGWVFRGQADAQWNLETKFVREARGYRCNDSYWYRNREKYILQDFQRGAHNYVQNLPESENYVDWLSLLQHHGGPTRFLDFSYSVYVALFFAVETAIHDSAIWAVNINKTFERLPDYQNYREFKKLQTYDDIIYNNNQWANEIIKDRKADDVVLLLEPFKQHERIIKQQGLFLFPGNIEKPFESNICSIFGLSFDDLSSPNAQNVGLSEIDKFDFSNISICKIVIPSILHSKAILELRNMNITSASLFPGIDGFARSLSYRFCEIEYFVSSRLS
jgi:hypothetical protein